MATYDLTKTTPSSLKTGDVINCPYSGEAKNLVLPKGKYKLEVWGAEGGYRSSTSYSGKGGYSVGTLSLTDKTTIYMVSGGSGNTGKTNGGYNGGGKRQTYNGGGGGSDIRIGENSLYARVIVAGGGGSDGASSKSGGYGGGTTGQTRTESFTSNSYCGYGGNTTYSGYSSSYTASSQSSSVSGSSNAWYGGFGFGGNGLYYSSGYGGAGGGGWYGGSGTLPDGSGDDDRGGGGGSGYVYTSSTASQYPSGCKLEAAYCLADASTVNGGTSFASPTGSSETGHSGDGYCRITIIECQSGPEIYVNISDSWKQASAIYINQSGTWKEIDELHINNGTKWI